MRQALHLISANELASGGRLGGSFDAKVSRSRIWNGRPPVTVQGIGPQTLALAANPQFADGGVPGSTVTVHIECANAWGGLITREFNIGGGLSAELRVGNFAVVAARVDAPIPVGMRFYFSWSWDLVPLSDLYAFRSYAVATDGIITLPEGCKSITVESACTLTFSLPQFGTTVVKAVTAGEEVPALWGAMSCNVDNKFIFRLRGL